MTMIGLLWFDDSPRSLEEKIEQAARRYAEKFGNRPTVCFVNPKERPENFVLGSSFLRVEARRWILPNHLWIGVDDAEKKGREGSDEVLRPTANESGNVLDTGDSRQK